MIDLHLLYHPAATRPDWWAACLASAVAAERRGCTVYVVEDPGAHVGAARARAYQLGVHPFVAALDSDDVLLPDAIPALLEVLERRPELCGVYSDRVQIDGDGAPLFQLRRQPWTPVNQLCLTDYPHQLALYRRAAVEPHLAALESFPVYSDFVLAGMAADYGPWAYVPVTAYQRREKPYYIHHRRPIDAETRRRARQLAIPPLVNHLLR